MDSTTHLINNLKIGLWNCNSIKKHKDEIKKEYESLTKIYESTRLVYDTKYSFQPDLGVVYHMYIGNDGETFLSIIDPNQWDREYLGSFILHANGTWEKVDYGI